LGLARGPAVILFSPKMLVRRFDSSANVIQARAGMLANLVNKVSDNFTRDRSALNATGMSPSAPDMKRVQTA